VNSEDVGTLSTPPSQPFLPSPVGSYWYDVPRDSWTWAPEVYAMHGLPPHVQPTTALFVELRHPDDRRAVLETLDRVLETGDAFSVVHRVVHDNGSVRDLALIGQGHPNGGGEVATIRGYFVDLTEAITLRIRTAADQAVAAAAVHRGAIEQAKGVLSLTYGLGDEEAMSLLRALSSRRNLKLNLISERLVAAARQGAGSTPALRRRIDELIESVTRPA